LIAVGAASVAVLKFAPINMPPVTSRVPHAFVTENCGELRLVTHAHQQAGLDDHHAIRSHRRVEFRAAYRVSAQLRRLVAEQALHDAADVTLQRRVIEQEFRSCELSLEGIAAPPQAALVWLCGPIAGRDKRHQVGGQHPGPCRRQRTAERRRA